MSEWVDVLGPGTWRLSDGRVVTYTPEDCANAVEQGNAMLAEGLSVPFCWNHDRRAKPERRPAQLAHGKEPAKDPAKDSDLHRDAWLSRGYFADAAAYRLSEDGRVQVLPVFKDPEDERQFKKVGGVSPRLDWDWKDETEKVWPGVTVTHVACTPRPIQRELRKRVPAMMGHATGRESVYLGYADMAEKDDKKAEGGEGSDAAAPATLIQALRKAGLNIPDEVSTLAELEIAVLANSAPEETAPDDSSATAGTTDAATPPAFMSHGAKPADAPAIPAALLSHFQRAARVVTGELASRIDKLQSTARIDGPTHRKLMGELKAANLSHESFDEKGDLRPLTLLAKVEFAEGLPPGRFAAADLSHDTKEVPAPDTLAAKSGVDEAADDMAERAGRYVPAKA